MQQFRNLKNRQFGAGLALAGLLCQLVLSFVHVPGAVASQSISETGQIENVICTPTGFKRVVIDLNTGLPVDGPSDENYDDVSVLCAICTSLANAALALIPDVTRLDVPDFNSARYGNEAFEPIASISHLRARQRAPPVQA
ncbi:MAG: hypothetical protein ACRBCJ_12535 [Hyphomicrobiaceae bacterium]